MDEQQAEAVPDGEATKPGAARPAGKVHTTVMWATLLVAVAALLGAGLLVWRGLQADKAIALVAQSVRQDARASGAAMAAATPSMPPAPMPAPAPAPTPTPAPAPAPRALAAVAVTPSAPAQISPVKATVKQGYMVKRPAVRSRALARPRPSARTSKRPMSAASVEQRLARCKDRAGEAAAACFARACASYASRAPICLNDEPARPR
jgi:cytoskeletal protein RodZ